MSTDQTADPRIARITREHYVHAAVALDTIEPIADRVRGLLAAGRRMTVMRRYVTHDATPEMKAGLLLDGEPRLGRQEGGAHFGVSLRPGINGFGFSAYASDGNEREADVWRRYHAKKDDSWGLCDLTLVEVEGGLPDSGPGRNDRLVIERWNQHGVLEEVMVAFDCGWDS